MYLCDFKSHGPKYRLSQEESTQWLKSFLAYKYPNEAETLIALMDKVSCPPSAIGHRATELIDYTTTEPTQWRIHGKNEASLDERLKVYEESADQALSKLFRDKNESPAALLHVSCTGYLSPSPAEKLAIQKKWTSDSATYHIYHMGCYAAFPAVTMASSILHLPEKLRHPGQRVSVVHTELCSLHLNLDETSAEQMVIQSLFADGHITYDIAQSPPEKNPSFKIKSLLEQIIPGTEKAMTWKPGAQGFAMGLSKFVPVHIKKNVRDYTAKLCEKAEFPLDQVLKEASFAIHPGGPKIIDLIKDQLELNEEQIKESRKVLKEHGNMSSATLPHVWQEILKTKKPGTPVVSMAFGPGLTISGGIFVIE